VKPYIFSVANSADVALSMGVRKGGKTGAFLPWKFGLIIKNFFEKLKPAANSE